LLDDEPLIRAKFEDFKLTYNKQYPTNYEEERRFSIFKENLQRAAELQELNKGSATFGVNKFSDISIEEFSRRYLNVNIPDNVHQLKRNTKIQNSGVTRPIKCIPDPITYDWTTCLGVIPPVEDTEGQCGDSWILSVVDEMESFCALASGELIQLSVQQVLDCGFSGEGCGCNGGYTSEAYEYIESCGGLESDLSYPFTANCEACTFNSSAIVCPLYEYVSIKGEPGLYKFLSSSSGGPISVCVDASSWITYTGGIVTQCGDLIDTCVQLTGYANYGEGGFWIVKNNWGIDWGEMGYIYIAIGENLCGIADYATVPIVQNI